MSALMADLCIKCEVSKILLFLQDVKGVPSGKWGGERGRKGSEKEDKELERERGPKGKRETKGKTVQKEPGSILGKFSCCKRTI